MYERYAAPSCGDDDSIAVAGSRFVSTASHVEYLERVTGRSLRTFFGVHAVAVDDAKDRQRTEAH